MTRVWLLLTGIMLSAFWASDSFAQAFAQSSPLCGPKDEVLAGFAQKYNEIPKSNGVTNGGQLVQILVSETGDWSLLVTHPSGISCLLATGNAWQNFAPHPQTSENDLISRRLDQPNP